MSTKTAQRHPPGDANMRKSPLENCAPAKTKASDEERFRLIQVRAYRLWELAGKPAGDAAQERAWHAAEEEVNACHETVE